MKQWLQGCLLFILMTLCIQPLAAQPGNPEAQIKFQQATRSLSRNENAKALQEFQEALKINPKMAGAWRGLGIALGRMGRWADAAQAQARATALEPRYAPGWVLRGWAEHRSGNHPVAVQWLQQALRLDPKNVEAHNALGVVYLFLNQPHNAEASTRTVLKLDPKNGTAWYNLGLSLDRQGRYAEAITAQAQAQKWEPNNPHPLLAQAVSYLAQNQISQARAVFQRAIALDPWYGQAAGLDDLVRAGFSTTQVARLKKLLERP
ncbi:MAG: tetratricopeptide repeat protein [Gloeomargarita sp. SKYG116]|nr:tetratricopeptide repeat protein [Gloeomargarita sp. SKYG116]MDW8402232.1 tetratricopeptide repeat protein [Gloeomargarita sp. SKYGB_i_bin116]